MEDHAVTADHAGEVPEPEFSAQEVTIGDGPRVPQAEPLKSVTHREERAAPGPAHGADHVLPPTFGQKPMIAARHEFRAVRETHAIRTLARRPRGADFRLHVPPVGALLARTDDLVAHGQLADGAMATVPAQHRGIG